MMSFRQRARVVALSYLALCVAGCEDNVAPHRYVPPAPVQPDPPRGLKIDPGVPSVSLDTTNEIVDMPVGGSGHRALRCTLAGEDGTRKLAVALADDSEIEFAEADFHLPPAAATGEKGEIMVCWNTLTGSTTKYSPDVPDPAQGMILRCRLLDENNQLGNTQLIESPTVGCWLRTVVALKGGGFRVTFKGDDGWFEADYKNPKHGVYEAYYASGAWSKPELVLPVPDPGKKYKRPE